MNIRRMSGALKKILVLLLLLTFAWQTRLALTHRYEVYDYLIPFIYLSDILIVLILITNSIESMVWIQSFRKIGRLGYLGTGLFIISLLGGVLASNNLHVVGLVYQIIKVVLFGVFAVWVSSYVQTYSVSRVMLLLSVGMIPLIVLGFAEMIAGKTFGLGLIGEWQFSRYMPGIATVNLFGHELMRPYATFPHPNVFGAVIGVFLLYWAVWLLLDKRFSTRRSIVTIILIALAIGVLLSFSRTVWFAVAVSLSYAYIHGRRTNTLVIGLKRRNVIVGLLLFSLGLVVFRFQQLFGADSLSFLRRWELNKVAFSVWMDNIFFGVGLNQFLLYVDEYWNASNLSRFVQPVHNIFMLLLAQTGIIGFIGAVMAIGSILSTRWQGIPLWLKSLWIYIAITGMFDHYWITLQVSMLMVSLILGFSLATIKNEDRYDLRNMKKGVIQ